MTLTDTGNNMFIFFVGYEEYVQRIKESDRKGRRSASRCTKEKNWKQSFGVLSFIKKNVKSL